MQKINKNTPVRLDVEANDEWLELLPVIKKDFPFCGVMDYLNRKWAGGQKQVAEARDKAWLEVANGGWSGQLD